MIRIHYIANTLREHRALFAFSFFVAGLFQVLILTLVVGADLLSFVEQFFSQLPPQVQMMFGEQLMAQFSVSGAVGFGYNHPMVIVLLTIVAIVLPARHVAGEVESGTLELLFAMPVPRRQIVLSLWVASGLVLLAIVIGCWLGTACGQLLFPEARSASWSAILKVGSSLWLLIFAISSYTLLISCHASEGSKATLRAAGLTLLFFFVNVAGFMWPTIDFLQPFSIFDYHQPQRVMQGEPAMAKTLLGLGTLSLVCAALALRQIARRDVPG